VNLLLGVSGGIAAYKAADLTSQLVKAGDTVRVVMTPSAAQFVGPITFEALTGHKVMLDPFELGGGGDSVSAIEHISWAKWADMVVYAPLTASTLAKLAHGVADNALTTVSLAVPDGIPQLLCPAMNTVMWQHPAVQRNLEILSGFDRYTLLEPVAKRLACGDVGVGGLAEVPEILAAIEALR
jgi:phosphopantothenoylcysteine decarboxylase/phosphopantothenate--cysteine ligase